MEAYEDLKRAPLGPAMEEEFHKIWDGLKPSVKKLLAEENEAIRDELTPSELREIGVTQEEPTAPAETFYYDSLPAPEMGGTWESLSPAFYKQATNIWERLKPEDREKLWSKVAYDIRVKIVETFGEAKLTKVTYVLQDGFVLPKIG